MLTNDSIIFGGHFMVKTTIGIEGVACGMCEARKRKALLYGVISDGP